MLESQFDRQQANRASRTERLLLTISGAFVLVNILALTILDGGIEHWLYFAGWSISAIAGTQLLHRFLPKRDPLLFPLVMFLSGWGLVIIDRLEPIFANRQTIWLLISVFAMLLTSTLPHTLRWLRAYRYLILSSGIVLLVSTILLGRNPSGLAGAPQLWLGIGDIFFQPSEVLKVILVAFLASYLAEQYPTMRTQSSLKGLGPERTWLSPRILGPILLMWGLSVLLVIWQRDLGTAALFFAVFLVLLYIASGQIIIPIGGFILLAIVGLVSYFRVDLVALRIDIWLNPWVDADGDAFQVVQSLMAFGAGGIFGNGIGQGSPIYIPVVHSDFIFAALSEEFGLLGVITLISVIMIFVMRGLRTAVLLQTRPFYALLAIGLAMLIGIQSLMIMAGVLKLLPLTGVTLPFMSYGGSSLLASYVMTGLLLRLSSEAGG